MRDVLIIGGGIAGLATAYRLRQRSAAEGRLLSCAVVERSTRFGGKILTDRRDGFVIEGGPDAFIAHKPWALELVQELGLGERLLPSNDEHRRSFIYCDRRLVEVPPGMQHLVPERVLPFLRSPLLSWRSKARVLGERFVPRRAAEDDESVADFVRRRLGREALERLAEPLLSHIHVGEIERMSLRATYPHLAAFEARSGSLWRGVGSLRAARAAASAAPDAVSRESAVFWTLRDGLAELVEALAARLQPDERLLGRGVASLERMAEEDGGAYRVVLRDGSSLVARAVVLATPADVSARILERFDPDLSRALGTIRYVSVATLSLAFRAQDLRRPLAGFGFFVPRHERRQILACTWTSTKFDHRGAADHVLLRVFLGGSDRPELLEEDDEALVRIVRQELRVVMGLKARPVFARLYRWPQGYPQYDVGHLERVRELRSKVPERLFLAGSAFDGVGLPDCIRSSTEIARQVLESFPQRGS